MFHPALLVRAVITVGLIANTPSAEAETRQACAKRDQVIRKLEEKFGETLRSIGLHQSEGVVEVQAPRRPAAGRS